MMKIVNQHGFIILILEPKQVKKIKLPNIFWYADNIKGFLREYESHMKINQKKQKKLKIKMKMRMAIYIIFFIDRNLKKKMRYYEYGTI